MDGFLQLLAEGKLNLNPLITHRFTIDHAKEAYELISGTKREHSLGVIFTYSEAADLGQRVDLSPVASPQAPSSGGEVLRIGLLGAGTFAVGTLLPALQRATNAQMVAVCAATGAHSRYAAEKFKFRVSSTDERDVLNHQDVNTVVIATRHHLHASQVLGALAARKNVFCEKPLCLNEQELVSIVRAHGASSPEENTRLMVGFNRRFSPMAVRMKESLAIQEPLALHFRINAGALPADHWINDPEIGGGRIVGEVCHFVDLLSFLAGALPIEVYARTLANNGLYSDDNVLISLRFENGSEGTIHYLANGDRAFSKERIEVFGGGAAAVLDDFRKLEMTRSGKRSALSARWRQDKGHQGEWQAFAKCLREGGPAPIPFQSIVSTTLTTFCIQKSRASGQPVIVDVRGFMRDALRNDS
jgi:predicted dehydrogenase